MQEVDVAIVGGGLVGGSLACALGQSGLRLAVIEAVPQSAARQPSYDERVIALSLGSRRIFEGIGIWPAIAPEAEPIREVHVSDRGGWGFARLHQRDEGVDALGYVAPARAIGASIHGCLARSPDVDLWCPARLLHHQVHEDHVALEVDVAGEPRQLRTRLLVAADGGDSAVRGALALRTREHHYGQDALVTTVTADRPREGVAFERFTDSGPLALLPMTEGRYSLVWTCRAAETAELLALSDGDFLDRLQRRFGHRLGRFSHAAARRAYPLKLVLTENPVRQRTVLIGNAAHTLHPVAGQGLNLGLRDVAALAEVVAQSQAAGTDPGGYATLHDYRRWRGRDQQITGAVTDGLARLFAVTCAPLRISRQLGMIGLDLVPAARHQVARRFMGLAGRLPRLARGLALEQRHA